MKFDETTFSNVLYVKKFNYYKKLSCVKTFQRRFFYFLCCIFSKYGIYNCEFQIIINDVN